MYLLTDSHLWNQNKCLYTEFQLTFSSTNCLALKSNAVMFYARIDKESNSNNLNCKSSSRFFK